MRLTQRIAMALGALALALTGAGGSASAVHAAGTGGWVTLSTSYHVGIYTQPSSTSAKNPAVTVDSLSPGDQVAVECYIYGDSVGGFANV